MIVDCELLLPKKLEEESLETADEPPILAFGDNVESVITNPDLSQPPYEKLKLEGMSVYHATAMKLFYCFKTGRGCELNL